MRNVVKHGMWQPIRRDGKWHDPIEAGSSREALVMARVKRRIAYLELAWLFAEPTEQDLKERRGSEIVRVRWWGTVADWRSRLANLPD